MTRHMTNEQCQFHKESILKEQTKRVGWHEKFGNYCGPKDPAREEEEDKDRARRRQYKLDDSVPKRKMDLVLPTINYPKKAENETAKLIRLQREYEHRYGEMFKREVIPDMKPASDELRQQLFEGFTKDQRGRYRYMKKRVLTKPEDKYEYPLLSSWDIGWKVGDLMNRYKTPRHGRAKIINDTFYRNNGIIYPTNKSAGLSAAM